MVGDHHDQRIGPPRRPVEDDLDGIGELHNFVHGARDVIQVGGLVDEAALDHHEEPVRIVVENVQRHRAHLGQVGQCAQAVVFVRDLADAELPRDVRLGIGVQPRQAGRVGHHRVLRIAGGVQRSSPAEHDVGPGLREQVGGDLGGVAAVVRVGAEGGGRGVSDLRGRDQPRRLAKVLVDFQRRGQVRPVARNGNAYHVVVDFLPRRHRRGRRRGVGNRRIGRVGRHFRLVGERLEDQLTAKIHPRSVNMLEAHPVADQDNHVTQRCNADLDAHRGRGHRVGLVVRHAAERDVVPAHAEVGANGRKRDPVGHGVVREGVIDTLRETGGVAGHGQAATDYRRVVNARTVVGELHFQRGMVAGDGHLPGSGLEVQGRAVKNESCGGSNGVGEGRPDRRRAARALHHRAVDRRDLVRVGGGGGKSRVAVACPRGRACQHVVAVDVVMVDPGVGVGGRRPGKVNLRRAHASGRQVRRHAWRRWVRDGGQVRHNQLGTVIRRGVLGSGHAEAVGAVGQHRPTVVRPAVSPGLQRGRHVKVDVGIRVVHRDIAVGDDRRFTVVGLDAVAPERTGPGHDRVVPRDKHGMQAASVTVIV